MRGWYGNKVQHGLASRGIKTKQFKASAEWDYLKEPFDVHIFREAEEHFDITDDIKQSGFILPNGKMLKFAKESSFRSFGHDEIKEIGISPREFAELGAVRTSMSMSGDVLYLSFYKPLRDSQKRTLSKAIKEYQPLVMIDIMQDASWDEGLNAYYSPTTSLEFLQGTYPSTVFRKIEEAMA